MEQSNQITEEKNHIQVWDPLVRLFHWALVFCFVLAYVTEEDFITIHTFAGYSIIALLFIRIVWGVAGSKYARFSNFVYSPKAIMQFLRDTAYLRAKRYIGHNPAGGAMIILLLVSLLLCSFSGLAVYAVGDHAGPLAFLLGSWSDTWADIFEEVHEFFANFLVFLIVIHILGVLVESILHRENLVRSMITGIKKNH